MATTLNEPPAAALTEFDRGYYGWRVVMASSLGVMVGFGSLFVYTFSVFMKPLTVQFGWSREAVSSGFGFAALSMAVASPVIGHLLDRLGPRRVILPCSLIYGATFTSFAFLRPHLWQFYATCVLLGVVGNGAAHLAYSRAISTWFHRRLGFALAMVMAGAGLGSMILPFVAQTIITRANWQMAYLSLGGLALCIGLPTSWKFIHERSSIHHDEPTAALDGPTWQESLRSSPFWIIVAVLVVSSLAMNGTVTHLVALLTDRGISPGRAALCASLLGGSSILGRVVVGWVLDRFFGGRVALVVFVLTAAGILLLARADSFATGCMAAGLIGIGAGGEADITPFLLTRYYGVRAFSTLYGLTWTFYAVAGAIGPIILGRAYDKTGSYAALLTLLAGAMILSGALMLLLPRYADPKSEVTIPAAAEWD